MFRKIGFGLLWIAFSTYAFVFAPPNSPDTITLITDLSTGKIADINPLIVALFYIMGVWPLIYSCVLFADGRGQKIPAWLFATLSFGVGAFALLPYLALREANPEFPGHKNIFLKILDSRFTAIVLTLGAAALVSFGWTKGDWSDFIGQWQTSRFIHVMSLDFCMLCLLFPALLGDDMARRGMQNSTAFWPVTLVPLFGPLAYLCTRKPLPETNTETVTN
ncbi:DUF2834 domain-containing protein [Microcoleus vaginatus PCC 9802]|uniref:hypothetical protein n=1 Tax=Microcoleus vaginatus TaxID=119532 RepID=UPI00020D11FC|nr:hypothetical protein MicvaDRAFT_5162 [Microcoleus vaginatus FGP-2]UNU20800.1 DUF2834 domain-containing protein [Microcoleus vaginatus PCC 9802]